MFENNELSVPGYSLGYYIPSGKDVTELSNLLLEFKHNISHDIVTELSHWAAEELFKKRIRMDIVIRALRSHETEAIQETALDTLGYTLAEYLKAVYQPEALMKTRETYSLKKIEWVKRKVEIENVYNVNSEYLHEGISVLIIDDIYSSGATMNEIIRSLKSSDINMSIYFFTLGKTAFEPEKNKYVSWPTFTKAFG